MKMKAQRNTRKSVRIISIVLALVMLLGACGQPGAGSGSGSGGPGNPSTGSTSGEENPSGQNPSVNPPVTTPEGTLQESTIQVLGSQSGATADGKFYLDYGTLEEEQEAAEELAIRIAAEGDVLLKNAGNILPLGSDVKRVSVFGTASYDLVHSGGGSGSGSTGQNDIPFKTLVASLEAVGMKINPSLATLYSNYGGADKEMPVSNYTKTVISTYNGYHDAAIITLSRIGSEDADLSSHDVPGHSDANDHELMLLDNEKDLIRHVKQYFDKVIVIINSSNVMQIPELNEEKDASNLGVDAVLWVGGVGNSGAMAIGQILTGEVNPSGKTVDLWEKDFSKSPTWTNFGTQSQVFDANGNRMDAIIYDEAGNDTGYRTVEYREGIYLGYRYYETLFADAAESEKAAAYSNVLYPFGYGLSYTSFAWELADDIAETAQITAANQTVTVKVKVTNTGSVAGKDVVQLYSNPPYTPGGIEKAAANLVGFAKTSLLQPGESETVSIVIAAQDLASYDWNDANGNGFIGYELEAGDYILTANKDSHTPVVTVTRTVADTILCKTDLITGETIGNVFEGDYTSVTDGYLENVLSRANGLKQPTPNAKEDRVYDDGMLAFLDSQENYQVYQDSPENLWYVSKVPDGWTQAVAHEEDFSDMTISLADMVNVKFNDPTVVDGVATAASDADSAKWDEFMNQLTWNELADLVTKGGGTNEIPSLGLDFTSYADGPVQMGSGTLWPSAPIVAATYNVELAAEQGRLIGNEVILKGNIGGWAGPAVNIHRNPLAGRAFEYYSEDGIVSARMAEAVVAAAALKGTITYVKHLILNDQEQYRNAKGGVLTFADEQVIREIYAKPFEALAKGGHTLAYMSSFNRIGYWNASVNYALHKLLVRGEWQFKGRSITDAWVKAYDPINLLVRTGDEQPLGNGSQYPVYDLTRGEWSAEKNGVLIPASAAELEQGVNSVLSPTHYYAVRTAAQHVLFSTANSIATKNGLKIETGHIYFGQYAPSTQAIAIEGLDDVANLEVIAGELPEGITVEGSSISGVSNVIGDYPITVSGITNNWITFEADVVVHVVAALEVSNGDTLLQNTDNDTITVKAGDAISLEFFSDYFAYGERYSLGGGLGALQIENYGFGRKNAGQVQIINLYQQFENWDDCTDTEANPLYRGNIGAIPRAEDATAGDMPVADVLGGNYAAAYEYSFNVSELPAGLTSSKTYQNVFGLSFGSYEAEKSLVISGTPTQPGTYEIQVTLQVPAGGVTGGWVGKLWFSGVYLGQIQRTITLVVE